MGIQYLHRFMKPFIEPVHIKKYVGKRVGIDAHSWLHKGAYSCSMELCLNSKSDKKLRYLQYFMHRINLLRHYKVIPVVVFDGGNIPCKAATEDERHKKREANLALAMAKLDQGDVTAATEFFQRAVHITPSMVYQLIRILRSESIEFIVAPYEADAQLAYLSSLEAEQGGIAAVITEDSDLMAYGCQAIIFKMDKFGNGEEILMDKVFNSAVGVPSFRNLDKELFTGMCVLAGCDFLPSVPGIGIKRAYSLVSKYRNLDRVLSVMKFEKSNQVREDYSKSFREAIAVFQHARIYDAHTKTLKPMKPLPQNLLQSLDGELDFLGPEIPSSIATAIAEGRLDPITLEAFDHFPSSESHMVPIFIRPSDQFMKDEAPVVSTQESCLTVFSPCETREEMTIVMEKRPALDDRKYLKETLALKQLIMPIKLHQKFDHTIGTMKFPDNNPFKKRKMDEIHLDEKENINEQASVMRDVEDPGDRKYLNETLALKELIVPLELHRKCNNRVERRECPENNPFKKKGKLDDNHFNQKENINEQVSVVIDVEDTDNILCMTPESQKSVDSKPAKVTVSKVKGKNEKKLKSNESCKSSENKKSSILNFFTRL